MIHLWRIISIMERKDAAGRPVPFSLVYVKKGSGEKINIDNAVLTSSHHLGTVNIMILESGQVRKLILPLIIQFNNIETFL